MSTLAKVPVHMGYGRILGHLTSVSTSTWDSHSRWPTHPDSEVQDPIVLGIEPKAEFKGKPIGQAQLRNIGRLSLFGETVLATMCSISMKTNIR